MSARPNKTGQPQEITQAVRFSVLGPFQLEGGQQALPRMARALLAYLVVKRGVTSSRAALADMFWRDRSNDQARASLRQSLSLIRKSIGELSDQVLLANREGVSIDPQAIDFDLEEFERLSKSDEIADLKEAVTLIRGEMLEDLKIDASPFEQWLITEREAFRQQAMSSYRKLAIQLEKADRQNEAIAYLQKQLLLDPADEEAHRSLIRLYTAKGRTDMALHQFNRCRRDLDDRLGVEPDARTAELARIARAARGKRESKTHEQLQLRLPKIVHQTFFWHGPELPSVKHRLNQCLKSIKASCSAVQQSMGYCVLLILQMPF